MEKTYSERMLDALESGNIDESNRLFGWALRKDDSEILYNLAEELYGLGFDGKALRIYQKLSQEFPEDGELYVAMADIEIGQGKNDEALEHLKQVSENSDAYLSALMVEADLYQTEELYEASETKLLTAYEIAPEEPAVIIALGELYNLLQDYPKAVKYYLELIKMGIPSFAKINVVERLAVAYGASGKFETAIAYFDQIHDEDLTPDVLFQKGLTYLQLKDTEHAQSTFERVIEMDSNYASAYPYLIQTHADLEQWSDALKVAQTGLGVDSYNVDLFLLAATMAEHQQEDELVQKYLETAHQVDPENVTVIIRLASFYNRIDQFAKTIDLLDGTEIDDPQVNWYYGVALWKSEQFEPAAKHFKDASMELQDNVEFLKDYYNFLRENGDIELAVSILRSYISLNPTDSEMQENLEFYEEQGY
ncbi:tetratricopeptide repeat protein [Pediococcus argentinicus]|uniref:tetratricopeptide repeat protein n=1 Tax=Pediococcus argentinicus TaxID=480391 RepID=UPI00338E2FAC